MDELAAAGTPKNLRRKMRAARRALGGQDRRTAEQAILKNISTLAAFRNASRVAAFVAFDGEPNSAPLFVRHPRKKYFVPVIGKRLMRFAAHSSGTRKIRNRFGISEPESPKYTSARRLDLVLTPLVAFDESGVRVGVGRGYYDRCFAYLRNRGAWHRPKLLGVAFECQNALEIEPNNWDVPLWGVVTETRVRIFDRGNAA
jgi:5-formyltetrahydrofolate cyclo-ligase